MTYRYGGLALAVLLGITVLGCGRGDATDGASAESSDVLEVEVVPVQRSQISSSLEVVGTLYPWKFATIAPEVSGVIERIPESGEEIEYEIDGKAFTKPVTLDIGHPVKKGDVLVKLDSTESELALKAAEARLNLAERELDNLRAWKRQEEVDQLQAQFEEATVILEDAQADLRRATQLHAKRAISADEYENSAKTVSIAEAAKKRAEAALKLAKAGPTEEQIAVAEAQVAMARAEVASQQEKLAKCTIHCPLETAVIVERYAGVGDRVTATPSTPIMRIIDPTILLAEVGVPERYQGLIKPKDMARLQAEGVTDRGSNTAGVPAMVVLVNAQIDPETRTFRGRVGIDNSKGLFKAGTFAKVELSIDSAADVVVPAEAITFTKGEPAAFVYRDGQVERRSVVLGVSSRSYYEIVSGLAEGDQVVKGSLSLLAHGSQVRRKAVAPQTPAPLTAASQR